MRLIDTANGIDGQGLRDAVFHTWILFEIHQRVDIVVSKSSEMQYWGKGISFGGSRLSADDLGTSAMAQ